MRYASSHKLTSTDFGACQASMKHASVAPNQWREVDSVLCELEQRRRKKCTQTIQFSIVHICLIGLFRLFCCILKYVQFVTTFNCLNVTYTVTDSWILF